MAQLTGAEQRRIQPKLRMIRNGDAVVNALRSEHSPSVLVSETVTTRLRIPERRGDHSVPVSKEELRKAKERKPGPGSPSDSKVSVFIDSQCRVTAGDRRGECGGQTIAKLTLAELDSLAVDSQVSHVEVGESVRVPVPLEGTTARSARGKVDRQVEDLKSKHEYGKDVLIGSSTWEASTSPILIS